MSWTPGSTFGNFRILAKAGEGGMGVVYRAHDTRLGRDVALKFLTRLGPVGGEHRERFEREARSLAALNDPGIVQIYEFGEDPDGVPYLVLEWVDGRPLDDPGVGLPLAPDRFLEVGKGIARSLASAHARGVVHRDVKPANVLLTPDGRTKLVDFGLAKLRAFDREITKSAGTVGTVAYMSPEQASGDELGPPSDVFSFGVMAYELLSGERPFQGAALGAVLVAILESDHVPLSQRRADLPPELTALIERCLAKRPDDRFADGSALVDALARVDDRSSAGMTREGRPADEVRSRAGATDRVSPGAPHVPAQDVRFCTTEDGVRIAYSVIGRGPIFVRVLGWFTHLEIEWAVPELRAIWERLAEQFTVVRYDGRGIGLSDRYGGGFTEETRQLDLEAVLRAVSAERALLFGVSEGGWTATRQAVDHPERVSHLLLYGAYYRGARARPGYDPEEDEALLTLIRKGWDRGTPAFRQLFTSQFFRDDTDPRFIASFNELQRASADAETAARYHESCHLRGDPGDLFDRVSTPTLVIHFREDRNIPVEEGRALASVIPGARLKLLPGGTHYFPLERPVIEEVCEAITRFVAETDAAGSGEGAP